ncbi:hypothetical protein F4820DRAFT_449296 [Hypoxylon rubiginosum]|uniref:Uncharacterized protein n=1 Tax=Hypoxylon rubiginosum TaxID=110542 RepID=A0ACB9YXM2_9PEZI|nr:hypothetical protein F4820DRAFT_449296 [Hypoxylon rubiginosum]
MATDQNTTASATGANSQDSTSTSTASIASTSVASSVASSGPVHSTDNKTINHPKARGYVDDDGKFHCVCGARPFTNATKNISSHISHMHNPDSKHSRKDKEDPRVCGVCKEKCKSFHKFETHIRNKHHFRGSVKVLWKRWEETNSGDTINVN